jgi:hypothetical protein
MATLYVDFKNGADTNDGSTGSPLKTLTHTLASHANNGDTIKLRGSSAYDEIYHERGITTALTTLTIEADAGHTPVLSAAILKAPGDWAKTDGLTNVYECAYTPGTCRFVFNGATLLTSVADVATCDTTANSRYADLAGDKLYINVGGVPDNIEVIDANADMLDIPGANPTLRGLTFQWAMNCVIFSWGGGLTLDHCNFRYHGPWDSSTNSFAWILLRGSNNTITGCNFTGTYISATNSTVSIFTDGTADAITIRNCTFDTGYDAIRSTAGTHIVEDCAMANMYNSGCWVTAGTVTLRRCIATNNAHDAFGSADTGTINLYNCIGNWTATPAPSGANNGIVFHANGSAYHCIMANSKRSSKAVNPAYNCATTGNVTIKNCIAYNFAVGIGDTTDANTPAGLWDADYNCIFGCTTAYGAGYSAATHDIALEPLFRLQLAGPDDFRLLPNSPCINAGLAIAGVNEGYRGPAPDIGAHEYVKPLPAHRHN